jgi:hypothetical protein
MRLEVTPLRSRIWLIKRQNDSVPGLYTYSVNDYEFDSFTPSTFPNNVDIRHSASLGFNYDILDNLKISVEEFGAMANRILAQLRVMKQSSGNNTMVNYGAPNSENLDDFMRLDASLVTVSISPQPLKPYAVESSISLMKTMSSTAITKSTQVKAILLP